MKNAETTPGARCLHDNFVAAISVETGTLEFATGVVRDVGLVAPHTQSKAIGTVHHIVGSIGSGHPVGGDIPVGAYMRYVVETLE